MKTVGQLTAELAKCRTQRNELLQTERGNLPAWVVSSPLSEVLDLAEKILIEYEIELKFGGREYEEWKAEEIEEWKRTIKEYRKMI